MGQPPRVGEIKTCSMTHSLHLAHFPHFEAGLSASRHDHHDAADNPLARFARASHSMFVAPAASEPTNHCAGCANADTTICGACITEARWRDGGLPHFRPVSTRAAEPEARAA
jgi:hypothetical protein